MQNQMFKVWKCNEQFVIACIIKFHLKHINGMPNGCVVFNFMNWTQSFLLGWTNDVFSFTDIKLPLLLQTWLIMRCLELIIGHLTPQTNTFIFRWKRTFKIKYFNLLKLYNSKRNFELIFFAKSNFFKSNLIVLNLKSPERTRFNSIRSYALTG